MKNHNDLKTMKKLTFIGLLLLTIGAQAQNRTISFETGIWEEVLQKAQKENKPIFVDAYAVWCGPCKWMSKEVFTNDTIADYYNTTFINVKMDMEKDEGVALAKEWNIEVFPTLLYFTPEGEVLHRNCGASDVAGFLELGKDAVNAEKNLGTLIKKYEGGNRDPELVTDYIIRLSVACMNSKPELEEYLATQKDEELTNERNWKLIQMLVTDVNSREFMYLENNKAAFEKLYTPKDVNEKINYVYANELYGAIYQNSGADYEKTKKELLKRNNKSIDKVAAGADFVYYEVKKDWDNYVKAVEKYLNTYGAEENYEVFNNVAWTLFENVNDKNQLNKALEWAKKSVELDENAYNLDTYANLLFVMGYKEEAIEKERKALEFARAAGNPLAEELEKALKKFDGE